MSRHLLAGSLLNEIAGSMTRYPACKVLVWNPLRVDLGDLAAGRPTDPPLDLTAFVDQVDITETLMGEATGDFTPTRAAITFRKNLPAGIFRRGFIADGVIVRILEGDRRVADAEWIPVFTGTFRGRPGENKGSRADLSEGLSANAYGREERYLASAPITTDPFPSGTDLGEIAYNIAWKYMGLTEDEILFGAFGFETLHITNQIADLLPLEALYECMFPAGKKPKFDALGRLCAVNVDLDKPAVRIYSAGDFMVEKLVATPNDIEVNNQVILRGLDRNKTRVIQDPQILDTVDLTTGFFDSSVHRETWYSQDRSQKAQDTYLVPKHRIAWSTATWTELDDFHGVIEADTHFLATIREIIFATYLAIQLEVAAIDFEIQSTTGIIGDIASILTFGAGPATLAALRLAMQIASQVTLAALLWSMQYIGRGEYEIWGSPFEYVFQELVSDNRLVGLEPEELRAYDYRNDFISSMDDLDRIGRERLRRELLKNQLYDISILADPLIEVDDVIETFDGSRYYVVAVSKTFKRGSKGTMTLSCWKVFQDVLAGALAISAAAGPGAGAGYGTEFGREFGDS